MFGIIVGTLALFIVLSGFSGLKTFSYSLLNTSDPDIKITSSKGKTFEYTTKIDEELISNVNIASFSKVVDERVFLKYQDKDHTASIKGVDINYNDVVKVDSSLWVGTWIDPEFKNTAVVGLGVMSKLSNLYKLDFIHPLRIYVPKPGKGLLNPNNAFNSVETQIIGVYRGSKEEFNNKYVFTELEVAQQLLGYNSKKITGVEIKLKNTEDADEEAASLKSSLGEKFVVQTKTELNALAYKVINTESFVSYLIFTLIVIIAMFNVIGAIIMMIIDKRKNLKTLLSLGAGLKQIKKIFVLQGFLLSVVGMITGLFIGVVLVLLQDHFGWVKITSSIAYPVEFRWSNLFTVMSTIIVLGFLAAKIASSRISKEFIEG